MLIGFVGKTWLKFERQEKFPTLDVENALKTRTSINLYRRGPRPINQRFGA